MSKPDKAVPSAPCTPSNNAISGSGCLVRLGWMVASNALLVIFAVKIAGRGGLSVYDILFWLAAVAALALRRIDIVHLHGQTVSGQAADLGHWRRYAILLPIVCILGWSAAHAIAYFGGK